MKVLIAVVLFIQFMSSGQGHEFKFFKVNRQLKQVKKSNFLNNTAIGEALNPIYEKILGEVGNQYQEIGDRQSGNILDYNYRFNLGESNFSGFTWQKPIGGVSIAANRQLAPDLFDLTRWIVSDTFEITVDAATYLNNLSEQNLIDITPVQLGLFAGISFKRVFRYTHFAQSFDEGLAKNFHKLFLSFMKFQNDSYLELEDDEILTKEDLFSARAGGLASTPPVYYLSISAGILASYHRAAKVMVQAVGQQDQSYPDEALRISMEKTVASETEMTAALQADFFNLLKITLFSYDMSYEYSETDKTYLSFSYQDLPLLTQNNGLSRSVQNILKLRKHNKTILTPFIVSKEYREEENLNSQYVALLWGGIKKRKTEQIEIIKDDKRHYFFRNFSEKIKYTKSFFSRLFDVIKSNLFKTIDRPSHNYQISRSRKLILEYELEEERLNDKNPYVTSEEMLSFELNQTFTIKKNRGRYRKYAETFLKKYTNVDSTTLIKVKTGFLKGPIEITSKIKTNYKGLKHLHSLSFNDVKSQLKDLCKRSPANKVKVFSFLRYLKVKKCYRKLKKSYFSYFKSYIWHREIPVKRLQHFLKDMHHYVYQKSDFRPFFGNDNLFMHGSLLATGPEGKSILTYFKEGEFNGKGVIQEFIP